MEIGNLKLSGKAFLSPMAEITDTPFRQVSRENGAALTFTQMISAKGILDNSFETLKYLAFRKDEKPIGIQLLGNDPETVKKAVNEVLVLKPDLIELNCSCSVSQVCNYGLGASLLDKPELLGKLTKSIVEAAGNIPVSIKIRAGRDRSKISLLTNSKVIEDNGASAISIHARTRVDKYSNAPDWNWIKMVKDNVAIKVIGNGSIFEPQDGLKMIELTGCDAVFISRGTLGNPFIFSRFNSILETGIDTGEPNLDDIVKTALYHFKLLLRNYGEIQGIKIARKFLVWYFKFKSGVYEFIDRLYSLNEPAQIEDYILEHSDKIKKSHYPEPDLQKIKTSFNERVLFWMIEHKSDLENNIVVH